MDNTKVIITKRNCNNPQQVCILLTHEGKMWNALISPQNVALETYGSVSEKNLKDAIDIMTVKITSTKTDSCHTVIVKQLVKQQVGDILEFHKENVNCLKDLQRLITDLENKKRDLICGYMLFPGCRVSGYGNEATVTGIIECSITVNKKNNKLKINFAFEDGTTHKEMGEATLEVPLLSDEDVRSAFVYCSWHRHYQQLAEKIKFLTKNKPTISQCIEVLWDSYGNLKKCTVRPDPLLNKQLRWYTCKEKIVDAFTNDKNCSRLYFNTPSRRMLNVIESVLAKGGARVSRQSDGEIVPPLTTRVDSK